MSFGHKLSSSGAIDENTTPVSRSMNSLSRSNKLLHTTHLNGWKFTQQWQRVSGRACFFVSIILQTTQGRRRLSGCALRAASMQIQNVSLFGFFQLVEFYRQTVGFLLGTFHKKYAVFNFHWKIKTLIWTYMVIRKVSFEDFGKIRIFRCNQRKKENCMF